MQTNVVSAGAYNFTVTGKNRPFSNDFTVQSAKVVQYEGEDEVACFVNCTADSNEPGRVYFAQYSTAGELMDCYTVN